MGIAALGEILDATLTLRPILPLLIGAEAGVSAEAPRVVLAAQQFDEVALAAIAGLRCESLLFDVGSRRGDGITLEAKAAWVAPSRGVAIPAADPERPVETSDPSRVEASSTPETEEAPAEEAEQPREGSRRGRSDSRRGRRSRRPERARATEEASESGGSDSAVESAPAAAQADAGIEEISLFDLDDDVRTSDEDGANGRSRSRGRRRGRRGRGRANGSDTGDEDSNGAAEVTASDDRPARAPAPSRDRSDDDEESLVGDEEDEGFSVLADDAPDLDVPEVPAYDEDEESEGDDDAERDKARRDRELRRRARAEKVEEPEPAPRQTRRRAAFVACADRSSILTTLVLARDLRLVEGFWVYPQEDLMTFFRSIATDLRDDTPIHLIGFNASPPARDTIQAAALFKGRLDWYDHHDWPPEDLLALREALGEDRVHVASGGENSLATVLSLRTRRSRFSDKLVELITGRFTQHDYERWGRLWWHRLGELAGRSGERRSDVDELLVGRPSELARLAADVPAPDPPAEVAWVAERDFRIVHFGGYVMAVLEVPQELDLHLAARVARERFDAQISLAYRPNEELLVLGGDEGSGRRGLDLGAMTAHLSAKLEWVEALADDDHVARMRVRNLWQTDGRMDEVVAEIAMGRSIVEG
jgi:hypothetical protein